MKVFIGYTLNKTEDEVKDICAVYMPNDEIVWVTDLRNFSAGLRTLDLFTPNPVDDDPIVVKPKNKKEHEQANDDLPLVKLKR